jgi:hypothetical protein
VSTFLLTVSILFLADPPAQSAAQKPLTIPIVTNKNLKELVREAGTPCFLFLFHGKHSKQKLQEQLDLFARESKKYSTRAIGFRLLDLDSPDGADIARVVLEPSSERLRTQVTTPGGSGFIFYFPGFNSAELLTYGNPPKDYVWSAMTEKRLEDMVFKYCSLKPSAPATPP